MKDARGHGSVGRGGYEPLTANENASLMRGQAAIAAAQGATNNGDAARELASGPKSAPAPVHDAMSNIYGSGGGGPRPARYGGGGGTQAWHSFGR